MCAAYLLALSILMRISNIEKMPQVHPFLVYSLFMIVLQKNVAVTAALTRFLVDIPIRRAHRFTSVSHPAPCADPTAAVESSVSEWPLPRTWMPGTSGLLNIV